MRSENSYIKLSIIRAAVMAQVTLYRKHHRGRIILIDGNAGDGSPTKWAVSTSGIVTFIAEQDGNADVMLCEKDFKYRRQLWKRFPKALVLQDNADAPYNIAPKHRWALWISDPCGPQGHGHEAMSILARKIPSDFVIALNMTACKRIHDCDESYMAMQHPRWWEKLLVRKKSSYTEVLNLSPNFGLRLLIVANQLSSYASSYPFECDQQKKGRSRKSIRYRPKSYS